MKQNQIELWPKNGANFCSFRVQQFLLVSSVLLLVLLLLLAASHCAWPEIESNFRLASFRYMERCLTLISRGGKRCQLAERALTRRHSRGKVCLHMAAIVVAAVAAGVLRYCGIMAAVQEREKENEEERGKEIVSGHCNWNRELLQRPE